MGRSPRFPKICKNMRYNFEKGPNYIELYRIFLHIFRNMWVPSLSALYNSSKTQYKHQDTSEYFYEIFLKICKNMRYNSVSSESRAEPHESAKGLCAIRLPTLAQLCEWMRSLAHPIISKTMVHVGVNKCLHLRCMCLRPALKRKINIHTPEYSIIFLEICNIFALGALAGIVVGELQQLVRPSRKIVC